MRYIRCFAAGLTVAFFLVPCSSCKREADKPVPAPARQEQKPSPIAPEHTSSREAPAPTTGGLDNGATGATPMGRIQEELHDVKKNLTPPQPIPQQATPPDLSANRKSVQQASQALNDLPRRDREARGARDKLRTKAEMLFARGKRLENDPLAPTWQYVDSYRGLDSAALRKFMDQVSEAEKTLRQEIPLDDAALSGLHAASEWAKQTHSELDHVMGETGVLAKIFRAVPLYFARTYDELDELSQAGWITEREPADEWRHADNNDHQRTAIRLEDEHAALYQRLMRHRYAAAYLLQPSSGDITARKSKWTWPITELFAVCASFDYWYSWATDASWYEESGLRLDPQKYPRAAPQTKALWEDFCSMIRDDFACPVSAPRVKNVRDYQPFSRNVWSLSALRRISQSPEQYDEAIGTEHLLIDDGFWRRDPLGVHFLTPKAAAELSAKPPPIPSADATREIEQAEREINHR